jgi:AmmeMemoRadiSam system protein B
MIRQPAVAGQFYPGSARAIQAELDRYIHPSATLRNGIAVVVPHAGWMYSGATAGIAYSNVRIPNHVIMLGPPYCVTQEQLEKMTVVLALSISAVCGTG